MTQADAGSRSPGIAAAAGSPSAADGRIATYVTSLLIVSWIAELAITIPGGIESPRFRMLAPVVMFFPGIGAILALLFARERLSFINWGLPRPRYLLYAALIPALTAMLVVFTVVGLGLARSPHLHLSAGSMVVERGLFVLGKGRQSLPFFALNLAVSALALGLFNGLVAAGEEVGWRGYLQKRLVPRLGPLAAFALVGLIWAHWHTPIILQGYNYPETPVLGALVLWPATCVAVSFLLGWLTLKGRSVWPAAVAHGSFNAFHGGLVGGLVYSGPRLSGDLVELAVLVVLAAILVAPIRAGGATLRES